MTSGTAFVGRGFQMIDDSPIVLLKMNNRPNATVDPIQQAFYTHDAFEQYWDRADAKSYYNQKKKHLPPIFFGK